MQSQEAPEILLLEVGETNEHTLADESRRLFWYSRQTASCFLIALVLVVIPTSILTPPFQSNDEFRHVQRAYLLSRGHVFLDTVDGKTGGNIDTGLLAYMSIFLQLPYRYEEKVTQKMIRDSKRIVWSRNETFSELPNMAVYFPFSYIPQATAFVIGQRIGFINIRDTYYLARVFSLVATIFILWFALTLYPVPLLVLALFFTPMAVFQLGSASLDSISFAMCVLTASLFLRAADVRLHFSTAMHAALMLCLLLLSTSRTNLVGLIWIPAILYPIRRSRAFLVSTGILVTLSISWIAFATVTVKGMRVDAFSPNDVISYYFTHIDALFGVMSSTVTNGALLIGYWNMFVGVLGWLDTPLNPIFYPTFAILLAALASLSIETNIATLLERARVSLATGVTLSTLLLFMIFLAITTPHPAVVVEGILGRYFYPAAIFLGFAFSSRNMSPKRTRVGICILVLVMALSILGTVPTLIGRYWVT